MLLRELISEGWSDKYKRSINCANPKGFSQKAHCAGRKKEEDYDPNDTPPGPEFKPTMPQGTVRVDVSDVYDWYKLGKNFPNLKNVDPNQFGKGPPSTIVSFGSEEEEHKYIKDLMKLGLTTTDIDPPSNVKGPRQKLDPTYNVGESKLEAVIFESVKRTDMIQMLKDFLPLVMNILNLKKLPHIKLHKQIHDQEQPTFGRFVNDSMVIDIGLANRHPNDILRTLAHELVHFKQLLDHKIHAHSGDTGSPEENEANAKAGVIMRHFNKKYPQYLAAQPAFLDETASVGATSAGNIASVTNPQVAIGNKKARQAYGKGANPNPPKAKQIKNKDGTAKNALDISTNIFGGSPLKR